MKADDFCVWPQMFWRALYAIWERTRSDNVRALINRKVIVRRAR